ncbi:unnamed protein product [Heligmosomoides polygyrus]|uniref:GON-4-like protein n=1 Tax=Heligmosomoides polygyrus TaxID=6339 RepID=A0A183GVS4_HELPZ|nr:unnamed protein product [Heligmosomoides polygyrus]
MASILKDFEACQLEVDEDEQLEVVEEEEEHWDPQDELMDEEKQASSENMTTSRTVNKDPDPEDASQTFRNERPDLEEVLYTSLNILPDSKKML